MLAILEDFKRIAHPSSRSTGYKNGASPPVLNFFTNGSSENQKFGVQIRPRTVAVGNFVWQGRPVSHAVSNQQRVGRNAPERVLAAVTILNNTVPQMHVGVHRKKMRSLEIGIDEIPRDEVDACPQRLHCEFGRGQTNKSEVGVANRFPIYGLQATANSSHTS